MSENQLTWAEAYDILVNASGESQNTRRGHQLIEQACLKLKTLVLEKIESEKPKPEELKEPVTEKSVESEGQ